MSITGTSFAEYLEKAMPGAALKSKGQRTRYRLKTAAAALLERTGYHDLHVAKICKTAGVSLGTFYIYFKDKRDIAREVLSDFAQALWQGLGPAEPAAVEGEFARIFAANLHYVVVFRQNPGLMRCLIQIDDRFEDFADIWRDTNEAWTGRFVGRAKSAGRVRASEASLRFVGITLGGMADQLLYSRFVRRDPNACDAYPNDRSLAQALSVLWYRALYAADPPKAGAHVPKLTE
jgi:AcrR family transcriptional regulator